ncbi:MAG: diguanylate cyclase, partial [Gammaproteobacteria bacterium]
MFRALFYSTWLAFNLLFCLSALAIGGIGSYWIVNDCDKQLDRQALKIQRIAIEALELSKGNVKALEAFLVSLPGSPAFNSIEIQAKGNTLVRANFDTPSPEWLKSVQIPVPAPFELALNEKNKLSVKFSPSPAFPIHRLLSLAPAAMVSAACSLLLSNLLFWLLKQRLNFSLIDKKRLSNAIPANHIASHSENNSFRLSDDLLDCLPDAILRCHHNGEILYANTMAKQWRPPSQSLDEQTSLLDLIAPWDRIRCAELLSKPRIPGAHDYFDTQAIGTQRGILPVTICFTAAPNNSEEVVVVLQNASTSRALQDKLDVRELLLNAFPQGLAVLSPRGNGELLYGSPAFKSLLNVDDIVPHSSRWLDSLTRQAPSHIVKQIRLAMDQMTKVSVELPWHPPHRPARILQLELFPIEQGEPRLLCSLRDCTEETNHRHSFERELNIRKKVLNEMPVGFCITDAQANITAANVSLARMAGTDLRHLIGSPISDWLPNHSVREHLYQREHTFHRQNESRFTRLNSVPLTTLDGQKEYAYFFEDITPFKQQALIDGSSLDRLQRVLDSIDDGIITTNENGFIQYMNPYAQKLTALSEHEYKGIPFGQAIHLIDEKKREPLVDPSIRAIRIGKTVKFRQDVLYAMENKTDLAVEISANPIYDSMKAVVGAVVVMKDVAEQRSLTHQMHFRASRDPLTGLVNRRELLSILESLQYEVEEQSRHHTLCYMDLDKFKVVNDTCGHNAGDELLRQVSNLMNDCLRTSDILARIGGDEFCAVLYNTPVENASLVAEKVREAIKRYRFTWDDKFFEIGISIGLFGLVAGMNVEESISAADHACYQAKEKGRDRVYITSSAKPGKPTLAPWGERLAEALDHDYFRLFRLDAQRLKTSSALPNYHEVLLQLHEPNQPPMVASAFMPNAHRINLAASIERWVIGKLFSTIGSWILDKDAKDIFSIQLSAATLAEGSFIGFLSEQCRRHGVSAKHVCFEIAEDDLVQNFSAVQRFMQEGKHIGYGFCLSRFGGGIS